MKLTLMLESGGGTTTGFQIPPDAVEQFNAGKRVPVVMTINGHSWHNTITVYNGAFVLGVSAENRAKAGIAAGDEVEIDLDLDTQPRTMEIPADLQTALDTDPAFTERFRVLSFSKQRAVIDPINQAKTPETRQRRIEKVVDSLRAERE